MGSTRHLLAGVFALGVMGCDISTTISSIPTSATQETSAFMATCQGTLCRWLEFAVFSDGTRCLSYPPRGGIVCDWAKPPLQKEVLP